MINFNVDIPKAYVQYMDDVNIQTVIEKTLKELQGKVSSIEVDPILTSSKQPDQDHNQRITIILSNGKKEKLSIFALKFNDAFKKEADLVNELTAKVTFHLDHMEDPNMLKLPSGTLYEKSEEVNIEDRDGDLFIDGKKVVYEHQGKMQPLKTSMIQTYSYGRVRKEGSLITIWDDYDLIRKDDRKGFFFNLDKPIENGTCLQLYRSKEQALH